MRSQTRVGFGGRLLREVFPIEDWPKSDQCPFPEANATNYNILKDLGLNTHFMSGVCGADPNTVIANAPKHGYYVLPSEDYSSKKKG